MLFSLFACDEAADHTYRKPDFPGSTIARVEMAHPLQSHYDHVSALLRELRAALEDHAVFRSRREWFDEYLEANELELALHSVCDALLEDPFDKPSAEVLKKIEDLHKAMELRDDRVERLLAF
jgi:hypothetical protein